MSGSWCEATLSWPFKKRRRCKMRKRHWEASNYSKLENLVCFIDQRRSNSRCLSKCFFTALKVAGPGFVASLESRHRLFINRMRALYWNIKQKHSLIFSLNFTQQLAAPWGDASVYWVCSSSDWHNHSQLYPRCFERGRQFPGLSCRDSPSRHEVWVR